MSKQRRAPFKLNVKIDVSEWELGNWPELLWQAVEVEKTDSSVTIEINDAIFTEVARKIAKEAIETFIDESEFEWKTGGIAVFDCNFEQEFTLPWDKFFFWDYDALDVVQKLVEDERPKWKKNENEEWIREYD